MQTIDFKKIAIVGASKGLLRLLDSLALDASSEGTDVDRRPIWELVDTINARLPADTWENVPTDGSINLDHYLYGAPKKQS